MLIILDVISYHLFPRMTPVSPLENIPEQIKTSNETNTQTKNNGALRTQQGLFILVLMVSSVARCLFWEGITLGMIKLPLRKHKTGTGEIDNSQSLRVLALSRRTWDQSPACTSYHLKL